MNHNFVLDPRSVHDAAAHLFWMMASEVGVAEANDTVIASAGRCLMEQIFTEEVLGRYGAYGVSHRDRNEFCNAIASEAENFARNGKNLNGIIYSEDADIGRSPSAMHVETGRLRIIPRKIIRPGEDVQKIGQLCLRYPLPAVVFSDTPPTSPFIEVADTARALGFHLPMFLSDVSTTQVGDNYFVSNGVFQIPVPDSFHGDQWNKAIPNSARFVKYFRYYTGQSVACFEVEW